jgi:CheY-like chemotaxis protein
MSMARRVLIVEDNADQASMLYTLVQLLGHEARCAPNGPDALRTARMLRPDLVLLDIGLPGIDGFQVARLLRAELGASVRIIAITAYGTDQDREQSQVAGCDVHLVKPADPRFLESLLKHH